MRRGCWKLQLIVSKMVGLDSTSPGLKSWEKLILGCGPSVFARVAMSNVIIGRGNVERSI